MSTPPPGWPTAPLPVPSEPPPDPNEGGSGRLPAIFWAVVALAGLMLVAGGTVLRAMFGVVLVVAVVAVGGLHVRRRRRGARLVEAVVAAYGTPGWAGSLTPEAVLTLQAIGAELDGAGPLDAVIVAVVADDERVDLWREGTDEPRRVASLPWERVVLHAGRAQFGALRRHAVVLTTPDPVGLGPRIPILTDAGVGIRLTRDAAERAVRRLRRPG